jgi:hypothetical protein
MAKSTQTQEESANGVLAAAAKTIGKAAGKVVSAVATTPQEEAHGANAANQEKPAPKISSKVPKLAKKNKSRLPRREKKARQKAGAV